MYKYKVRRSRSPSRSLLTDAAGSDSHEYVEMGGGREGYMGVGGSNR